MPKLSEILFGKKDKIKQAKTLTPQQEELMALISEGLKSGQGPLADIFGGFNKEQFEESVTQPALKNFKENILPQILEKFVAGNQAQGSGIQRAAFRAGTDLQSDLSKLMYGAQQEAVKNRLAGLQTSLGTPAFQNIYQQGTTGLIPGLIQGQIAKSGPFLNSGLSNLSNLFSRGNIPQAGGQAGVTVG